MGHPRPTPEGLLQEHRSEPAALAADFEAGRVQDDVGLRWSQRLLSIDGRARIECGYAPSTRQQSCALYLPLWQSWRAEVGDGIAYLPIPPALDTMITTAAGDAGTPVRKLGDGWWLIA